MARRDEPQPEGMFPIGKIVGTFGLKGEVKLEPYEEEEDLYAKGRTVYLNDEPIRIRSSRYHKGRYLLILEGYESVELAQTLQWRELFLPSSERPEMDEDEYLVEDLIGLRVLTHDGRELGEVQNVLSYPAHDLLVVGELLIPAVRAFVETVDFDAETITVRWIEGLGE